MKKLIVTASAVSMLAFGVMVSAEQQLSLTEMDGVTAGGIASAVADARARGVNTDTYTSAIGITYTVDSIAVSGQLGTIDVVRSEGEAISEALATSGGFSSAIGMAVGTTEGTLASDVDVRSFADADTTGALIPGSRYSAFSSNVSQSVASEIVRGRTASANSTSSSVAAIGN